MGARTISASLRAILRARNCLESRSVQFRATKDDFILACSSMGEKNLRAGKCLALSLLCWRIVLFFHRGFFTSHGVFFSRLHNQCCTTSGISQSPRFNVNELFPIICRTKWEINCLPHRKLIFNFFWDFKILGRETIESCALFSQGGTACLRKKKDWNEDFVCGENRKGVEKLFRGAACLIDGKLASKKTLDVNVLKWDMSGVLRRLLKTNVYALWMKLAAELSQVASLMRQACLIYCPCRILCNNPRAYEEKIQRQCVWTSQNSKICFQINLERCKVSSKWK